MAARIGNVIYWFCSAVAALCFAIAFSVWLVNFREMPEGYLLLAVSFVVAFCIWLVGKAFRYVLAG